MENNINILLPRNLRGRSLHINVIPTVCSIKNMINKLKSVNGDVGQLKHWEKRSYKAYQIDKIKSDILVAEPKKIIELVKNHILNCDPNILGASCIDIYLVAYVSENYGVGKQKFFEYILKNGISEKENSVYAIWQVGKGDGIYLGLLNKDGSIRDLDFFVRWVNGNDNTSSPYLTNALQLSN